MTHRLHAIRFLLIILTLSVATPTWAVPLTGFLEATYDSGWQGAFAVQLTDGSVVTGVNQVSGLPDHNFQSLPLITEGCTISPGTNCVSVTNVNTSSTVTMTFLALGLGGSSTLGNLGAVSWGAQPLILLPGDPSPTVAVLATTSGTLGGTTLTPSSFSFGFNSTLTASFISTGGGQALSSLRLDFTDGIAPPTSGSLRQGGTLFVDNGVPVALGTPLSVAAVPEPSSLVFLACGLSILIAQRYRRIAKSSCRHACRDQSTSPTVYTTHRRRAAR